MQAVILAGGQGIRLRPITKTIPKPMIPLNGKPYLEYQIEYLKKFGFSDILILVGYLGKKIEAHFGNGKRFGVNIKYSYEKDPMGTAGGLKNAEPHITTDKFLLLYGDSFLPINLTEFTTSFLKCGKKSSIVIYNNQIDTNVKNNVKVDGDNISAYKKDGGGEDFMYVDSGVLCLDKGVLKDMPENTNWSLEFNVFPSLIENRDIFGYVTTTRFYDIGTPKRLADAESFFREWEISNE